MVLMSSVDYLCSSMCLQRRLRSLSNCHSILILFISPRSTAPASPRPQTRYRRWTSAVDVLSYLYKYRATKHEAIGWILKIYVQSALPSFLQPVQMLALITVNQHNLFPARNHPLCTLVYFPHRLDHSTKDSRGSYSNLWISCGPG